MKNKLQRKKEIEKNIKQGLADAKAGRVTRVRDLDKFFKEL